MFKKSAVAARTVFLLTFNYDSDFNTVTYHCFDIHSAHVWTFFMIFHLWIRVCAKNSKNYLLMDYFVMVCNEDPLDGFVNNRKKKCTKNSGQPCQSIQLFSMKFWYICVKGCFLYITRHIVNLSYLSPTN